MDKKKQIRAFENDLLALCTRYILEFDIDAAIIMYVFMRTMANVFGDLLDELGEDMPEIPI